MLTLAHDRKVEMSYCPHCAGESRQCHCGALANWTIEAPDVVHYDANLEEYRLAVGEMEVPFRFCPCCGGALRGPAGPRFEDDRSEAEIRRFSELIGEARTLDEVIRILGEPDARVDELCPTEGRVPDQFPEIIRSLEFSQVSRTLRIIVQELVDGSLQVVFGGKPAVKESWLQNH